MELMNKTEVAELLGVTESRIERMAKENLLSAIEEKDDTIMFDKAAIERYKTFADRLGGL